ncbi:MAG: metal-binding protein SmbP [Nitrosomonadales bacterium SCN 54-20]|nr:metal-binding protein SmbP [Nitrosospira multiformis]ODT80396.1 MAG: metal-binding protein SmbP [Nitrosomonadales bacterium SCN 54-20]
MRYIPASFAIGVLGVLLATPVIADHHTAQAIEHAAMAKAYSEDGHAKVLRKHAEESLVHAQEAEKKHAEQHMHMTDSIKELKQAIEHAKAGHTDIANKHIDAALMHMRKSTND